MLKSSARLRKVAQRGFFETMVDWTTTQIRQRAPAN
jgi:hypothetical protein